MKKLSAILITAVLVLSLSACGTAGMDGINNSDGNGNSVTSQPAESSTPSASSQQSVQGTAKITADEALNIALENAGVTKDSISNLKNKLDTDDGILVYEIDFDSGNTEYSYDINAETGAIVESDRDRAD